MMACASCNRDTLDNPFGPWCDVCGGVAIAPGNVIFRHVATVAGKGGVFAIVFDASANEYAYIHKHPNPPRDTKDVDGFKPPHVRMSHGTLDAMIAVSYPDVKGGPDDDVTVAPAPSATDGEQAIVERAF